MDGSIFVVEWQEDDLVDILDSSFPIHAWKKIAKTVNPSEIFLALRNLA